MKSLVDHMRLGAAAFCAVLLLAGGTPALAASARQDAYDAAQAAYDRGDWNSAIAGFLPLLPVDPNRPLGHSEAVIASRLGEALVRVQREDEAGFWLGRAIAALPADDSDALATAWLSTGELDRYKFDYSAAIAAYRQAADHAAKAGDAAILTRADLGIALAGATVDPKLAAATLDPLLEDPKFASTVARETLAEAEDLRARAAINLGDKPGAKQWIGRALDHSGGLTPKVDLVQVAIRGDAAIIARLSGDDEGARQYLAYTGAGHIKSMDWIGRYEGELPVCGEDGDARPDDSVVIEFALADNGRVAGAIPVYASRPGDVGPAFARAISGWRWDPAQFAGVDPFWRADVRFELRCASRPKPLALGTPYQDATHDWLEQRAIVAPQDVVAIPALLEYLRKHPAPDAAMVARLDQSLDAAHAPPSAYAIALMATNSYGGRGSVGVNARLRASRLAAAVPAFRQRFPNEAAGAWLTLEWALAKEDAGDFSSAPPLLQAVLDFPTAVLPAGDPVRQVATLHLALAEARTGNAGAAQAGLAAAGLDAEQCALFDTRPIAASVGIASTAFPLEAMRWHFEGYVQEAYDIGADGHVANIRTVVAYPPYIFGPDTERAVRSFRYLAPSVGGHAVGCVGETQAVRYRLPG